MHVFHLSGKCCNHWVRHSSAMKTFVIIFPKDVRVHRKEFEPERGCLQKQEQVHLQPCY